jgi:hypothetical protein
MVSFRASAMDPKRKYFLIALVVVLSIAVLYRYAPEIESALSGGVGTRVVEAQVAKFRRAVGKKDRLQEQRMRLERVLSQAESGLLNGDTKAIAAVDIQNILNALAEQSGVRLKTIRVLKPAGEAEGAYVPIPVQITFDASVRQVKEIFYRIENASKLLRIPDVRIRLVNPKTPEAVQTTLTVEGFMKAAGAGELEGS